MTLLALHPDFRSLRVELRENCVLRHLGTGEWQELEPLLEVAEYRKGETLEYQGDPSLDQYFVIEGILKRVVASPEGKEMILRFAAEGDIDTSYAAYRLGTPIPFSIR